MTISIESGDTSGKSWDVVPWSEQMTVTIGSWGGGGGGAEAWCSEQMTVSIESEEGGVRCSEQMTVSIKSWEGWPRVQNR